MNVKLLLSLIIAICLPLHPVFAQGFAGLGGNADGFTLPQQGYVFDFPKDHGAHPDFRIEWWYLTANLKDKSGQEYGVQWTLFRSAMRPTEDIAWNSPQLWMAHAAVTTPTKHYVAERRARGGTGQAGVTAAPFEAWIDEWHIRGPDLSDIAFAAAGDDFAYQMTAKTSKPLVMHGSEGYSQKSSTGRASYYYSQPFYDISGTLRLPDGDITVTGTAWLDREWASQPLGATQVSWDWFSMVFDDGARLMGFTLRDTDGGTFTAATWIDAAGVATPFADGAFTALPLATTPQHGREVPTTWRARLPEKNVDVIVEALNPNAWMTTSVEYWEGPVRITGSHQGRGYLEMTGY